MQQIASKHCATFFLEDGKLELRNAGKKLRNPRLGEGARGGGMLEWRKKFKYLAEAQKRMKRRRRYGNYDYYSSFIRQQDFPFE